MRRKLCKFVSRPVIDPWEPELLILYLPITGQLSNLDTKITKFYLLAHLSDPRE